MYVFASVSVCSRVSVYAFAYLRARVRSDWAGKCETWSKLWRWPRQNMEGRLSLALAREWSLCVCAVCCATSRPKPWGVHRTGFLSCAHARSRMCDPYSFSGVPTQLRQCGSDREGSSVCHSRNVHGQGGGGALLEARAQNLSKLRVPRGSRLLQ